MSSTETAQGTLCTPTKRPRESGTVSLFFLPVALYDLPHLERQLINLCLWFSASGSESEATPEKRPRTEEKEGGSEEARGTPKQKNRRRCYRCQTKLELVQQELGSCRCGQYHHVSTLNALLTSTYTPLLLISLTVLPQLWLKMCQATKSAAVVFLVWPEKLNYIDHLSKAGGSAAAIILTLKVKLG